MTSNASFRPTVPEQRTLLELVWSAGDQDAEPEAVIASVVDELESGRVCLCGNFRRAPVSDFRSALQQGTPGESLPREPSRRIEAARPERLSHYCLHCLTPVDEDQAECGSCAAPFQGAGSFDRIAGPPPSREFAFLFTQTAAAAAREEEKSPERKVALGE